MGQQDHGGGARCAAGPRTAAQSSSTACQPGSDRAEHRRATRHALGGQGARSSVRTRTAARRSPGARVHQEFRDTQGPAAGTDPTPAKQKAPKAPADPEELEYTFKDPDAVATPKSLEEATQLVRKANWAAEADALKEIDAAARRGLAKTGASPQPAPEPKEPESDPLEAEDWASLSGRRHEPPLHPSPGRSTRRLGRTSIVEIGRRENWRRKSDRLRNS